MNRYIYTSLAELDGLPHDTDENLKVNVYAFIVDLKIHLRSKDMMEEAPVRTELVLRDGSMKAVKKCVIYSESLESFSDRVQKGQIIRMHRAKMKTMANENVSLYGKLRIAGFAVLLFSGHVNDDFAPLYQSSSKFTITPEHEEKIRSLRVLFAEDHSMTIEDQPSTSGIRLITSALPLVVNRTVADAKEKESDETAKGANVRCLNQIVRGGYSDNVVQAIAVFISDQRNVMLRCWDTTSPPRKISRLNTEFIGEVICRDENLETAASNFWCDVVLYGEHADFVRNNVKPGDILLLINMHCYYSKNGVALTMHDGGKRYRRSITVLDDGEVLKTKVSRDIEAFMSKRETAVVSAGSSNMQNQQNIDDVQHDTITDTQSIAATQSFHENQQIELEKRWAGERMRQIHATQLTWIQSYIWKRKQQRNLQHQRFSNLAAMAIQFIARQALDRLFKENRDSFMNLTNLSRGQRNTVFLRFLSTYLEGTYGDMIASQLDKAKQQDRSDKQTRTQILRKDESAESDIIWGLLCNLLPGTVLKLSGWQVNFSYDRTNLFFVLICNKCGLWRTTSPRNFNVTLLCPVCFKQEIKDSQLYLQCYFSFSGTPHKAKDGNKKYYFLFPIQLLAFFLVDVPESAQEAAHSWRGGMTESKKKALATSVQDKMLSKYKFALDEITVRNIKGDIAILEVGKLTFADL